MEDVIVLLSRIEIVTLFADHASSELTHFLSRESHRA
jgi:hypothetical protein